MNFSSVSEKVLVVRMRCLLYSTTGC